MVISAIMVQVLPGQSTLKPKVHSHNDYHQPIPFWTAYNAGAESIEADIFLRDSTLYVTHSEQEIIDMRTLYSLYLSPLKSLRELGAKSNNSLQLLIDIKSEPYTTMNALVDMLDKHLDVVEHENLNIVISGSMPEECDFINYPTYLSFDCQSRYQSKACDAVDKIGLISFSFKSYSDWDGQQSLPEEDRQIIETLVREAHGLGKLFRFWATPDTPLAWSMLASLGVDYINTDDPSSCKAYFNQE